MIKIVFADEARPGCRAAYSAQRGFRGVGAGFLPTISSYPRPGWSYPNPRLSGGPAAAGTQLEVARLGSFTVFSSGRGPSCRFFSIFSIFAHIPIECANPTGAHSCKVKKDRYREQCLIWLEEILGKTLLHHKAHQLVRKLPLEFQPCTHTHSKQDSRCSGDQIIHSTCQYPHRILMRLTSMTLSSSQMGGLSTGLIRTSVIITSTLKQASKIGNRPLHQQHWKSGNFLASQILEPLFNQN